MTNLKLFASATLVLALTACGAKPQSTQATDAFSTGIVAGKETAADDEIAKSTVALLISLEGHPEVMICSGTLVAPNIVVTAAHCLEDYSDFGMDPESGEFKQIHLKVTGGSVIFSTTARAEGVTKRTFTKFVKHPEFGARETGEGDWNDIAVLKFDGDTPEGYKPVPMLKDVSQLKSGMEMTFAGYGITSPKGNFAEEDDSGILRQGDTVLTKADHEGNELLFDLPKSQVSTCQGDSGGPAYAKISGQLTLVGVTSRGEDAFCRGVSISTSVASHVDFLTQSMGSMQ